MAKAERAARRQEQETQLAQCAYRVEASTAGDAETLKRIISDVLGELRRRGWPGALTLPVRGTLMRQKTAGWDLRCNASFMKRHLSGRLYLLRDGRFVVQNRKLLGSRGSDEYLPVRGELASSVTTPDTDGDYPAETTVLHQVQALLERHK